MISTEKSDTQLLQENADLRVRLEEAEETLRAIRSGEVDAIVVSNGEQRQVFTLKSADHAYRLLIEQMPLAALTVTEEGLILYCNQAFAEISESPLETIISTPIDNYLVQADRGSFRAFLQSALKKRNSYGEFNIQIKEHQTIPVYISANLLLLQDNQVICLIMTDLRERKQVENKIIELMIEKQRATLLADFVRNTSHDLRTPISVILTALENLEHIQDHVKRRNKLKTIESYVIHLNNVLEQLQQMAMLNSISELQLYHGSTNKIIMDAISLYNTQVKDKNISISILLAPDSERILLNADTLHRALAELIKNAIQFTPVGGQIEIQSIVKDGHLIIEVGDNGVGISAESLPHVFEPLYKVDRSRKLVGGAGLGLSITKRIIELHHGSITVESVPGHQTSFRIALPLT